MKDKAAIPAGGLRRDDRVQVQVEGSFMASLGLDGDDKLTTVLTG